MQFLAAFLVLSAFLTSKALAFDLNFTGSGLSPAVIPPSQFLGFDDPEVLTTCQKECSDATATIQACGDTNDVCLCSDQTIQNIVACHQCVFSDLIHKRKVAKDVRENGTPALAAWKTSCITSAAANGTLAGVEIPSPHTFDPFAAKFAIAPPSDWDGPFGQGLNMGATVVTVIIGALLGSGLITVLCTM